MHLVLLGDSVFDNQNYVGSGCDVTSHLAKYLPPACRTTLLAVDGSVASQVVDQIQRLPSDTTHIALSVGGNDALKAIPLLGNPVDSVHNALQVLHRIQSDFSNAYSQLISTLTNLKLPLVVCTIYDGVPGLTNELRTALSLFNDTITRVVVREGLVFLDLRCIFSEFCDYSEISPIEPSSIGGDKLACRLAQYVLNKPFTEADSKM